MLTNNTMRFGTDEFKCIKWSLLVAKDLAFDLSKLPVVEKINVNGTEPEGTKRRFMFKVDGKVYRFQGQKAVEYTGEINVENVLDFGNTAAEVQAVKNFNGWGGQQVYPIIALYSEVDDVPTVRLSANLSEGAPVLEKDFHYWSVIVFPTIRRIIDFELIDPEVEGDAGYTLGFQYTNDGGETWSANQPISKLLGRTVCKYGGADFLRVRFVVTARVGSAIPDNSVRWKGFRLTYTTDTASVVYGEEAVLRSIRENYFLPIKQCSVVLKHEALSSGASIEVYAHTSPSIMQTTLKSIGVGTGSSQTYTLTTAKNFRVYTLKVFIDGTQTTDFDANVANNTITLTAPNGAGISASYVYAIANESWTKLTADPTQSDVSDGLYVTRYSAPITATNHTYGVVEMIMRRPLEGDPTTIKRTATGAQEQYKLPWAPDNIDCNAEEWDLDDETNILTYKSAAGSVVNIKFSRVPPTPCIRSWTARWVV